MPFSFPSEIFEYKITFLLADVKSVRSNNFNPPWNGFSGLHSNFEHFVSNTRNSNPEACFHERLELGNPEFN